MVNKLNLVSFISYKFHSNQHLLIV